MHQPIDDDDEPWEVPPLDEEAQELMGYYEELHSDVMPSDTERVFHGLLEKILVNEYSLSDLMQICEAAKRYRDEVTVVILGVEELIEARLSGNK